MLLASPLAAQTLPTAEPTPPEAAEPAEPAMPSQGRSGENAVRQADDAFGFSVGRETLGLYSSSNVRGFSPFAAGNVRIEGLYFDPYLTLLPRLRKSTAIRVGISAIGYPFPSPTGIVDYSFRKPGDSASLSALTGLDSYGNAAAEFDAALPLSRELSLGFGAQLSRNDFYNGTTSLSHNQAAALRWRPSDRLEIIPFAQRSEVLDDEAGPIYVPAGPFLPPPVPRRRFDGPSWADYNSVGSLFGILVTASPAPGWQFRTGLFRSLYNDRTAFAHLLVDLMPDGTAERLIIADPPSRFISSSGEMRLSRSLAEGPRLHVIHLSVRGRDRRARYDGSDAVDFGPMRIGERFDPPPPEFIFSGQTRDQVRQWSAGMAYQGLWRDVGELSFGISRTDYLKKSTLPGEPALSTRSRPWLYNVATAVHLSPALSFYAGYSRGLEESGTAPDNASNRNQPLPAILTRQVEAGMRLQISTDIKLIAGAFDLRKPYYNLDANGRYDLLGDVVSQGVEASVSGNLTPSLRVIAGGVLLRPRVTGEGVSLGRVGERPVGLSPRSLDFNLDWDTPLPGISTDIAVSNSGSVPATRNNLVFIPARTLVDVGGRYRFRLAQRPATLRVSVSNLFHVYGFELRGAGAYDIIPGRVFSAYLTVDI
ncbi:TonB-dependent receptor domain-containing protein [Sandaracinobacteroides hominis]|uniref:TonB-dependent receptor domain-containing protein n=1 Tax=Sandaracinobacteroides hominis TaxID=2780086 RepID=UPI001F2E64D1|nr:TonB-dependent receptor [Sandaracinobacteroides hominis]